MYETIRIVGKLRPKIVIWENVKNLLSAKHKHNFDAYIETMKNLGYTSYYQVLNAKDYGIPQNRERVFTVSLLNGEFEFPPKQELKLRLKDMLEDTVEEKYYLNNAQIERIQNSNFVQEKSRIQEKDWYDTLCTRDWKDPKCVRIGGIFDTENSAHQAGSIYDKEGIAPTLDTMEGGWRQPSVLIGAYARNFGSKGKMQGGNRQPKIVAAAQRGRKEGQQLEISNREYSNALATVQKDSLVSENYRIRKLTPKECWRLMGFLDEEFKKAELTNSNTQLYKQAGNSIVVNVLMAIFKQFDIGGK